MLFSAALVPSRDLIQRSVTANTNLVLVDPANFDARRFRERGCLLHRKIVDGLLESQNKIRHSDDAWKLGDKTRKQQILTSGQATQFACG